MKTIQELYPKYLNNQCSPEEVKQLLSHFNVQNNEEELRRLIIESLESSNEEEEVSQWNAAVNESFEAIKKRLDPDRRSIPLYKQSWFRVAAALVIVAGGLLFFTVVNNNNTGPKIANVDTGTQQSSPGSNKAILTLADGSTIVLQEAAKGTVAQQGVTKIEKTGEGLLTYIPANENPGKEFLNTITSPRGGQYQVRLSDGSKIWLNAGSTLRFPAQFNGSERKVELTGEAYFEVAKNTAMPFKVATAGKQEVEVLGTCFNVNAYADEPVVKTTLLEGKVKVVAHASQRPQILNPGEESQLDGDGKISISKNADAEQTVAWKNGHFSFNNADLKMILRQLSRWYDVDVQFEGPVSERQFTGEIQRDWTLPQVLKVLERNKFSFKLQGRTLVVLK